MAIAPEGSGSIGAAAAGPIVPESARHRTIACEMTDASCGCKQTKFETRYEEGKLSLSQAEFDAAVAEVNSVISKPIWHVVCWPFRLTDPTLNKLDEKCAELTSRLSAKRVSFHILTRERPDFLDSFLHEHGEDKIFLVVRQHVQSVVLDPR